MKFKLTKYISLLALTLFVVIVCNDFAFAQVYRNATFNITINVASNTILTDASNDTAAGSNPTLNQAVTVLPDVGELDGTTSSSFRMRTNENSWSLSYMLVSSDFGVSMITTSDPSWLFSQTVGSNGMAGSFISPFPGPVNFTQLNGMTIITGSAKTSSARDLSNTNNYVQITTQANVPKDFYFEEDPTPYLNSQYTFTAP